jgi:hypothetical protein
MSRENKLVTSQIDGSTSARNEPNTYSYDSDGVLVRSDSDRVGKSVVGPGVLYGANKDSADQSGLNTIKLIPNEDIQSDQYLIIEPTTPNHIHIRAGGTQDNSTAQLILGGEETNVSIYDVDGIVRIATSYRNTAILLANESVATSSTFTSTTNEELFDIISVGWRVTDNNVTAEITAKDNPEPGVITFSVAEPDFFIPNYSYTFRPPADSGSDGDVQWSFTPNGVLYGPVMGGGVKVSALGNAQAGEQLGIYSNQAPLYILGDKDVTIASDSGDIILNANDAAYLGDATSPGNQIATLADRAYVRVNVPTTSLGQAGDVAHYVADDTSHHYFCTGTYDGTTHIWKRVAWINETWGV